MAQSNTCIVCRRECKMMCRSGTGICSENCDKEFKSVSHISEGGN